MKIRDNSELYIRLFEDFSLERIADLENFVSADIKFKDPFNDLAGIDSFRRLLKKILVDVKGLKFKVTHRAWSNERLFLRWFFEGDVRGLKKWKVEGMSEISFDAGGLICHHEDHWDASTQFYEKLPVVGAVLRFIRCRLEVS